MTPRDDILRLLPPPARATPPADWSAVVAYLGTDLPAGCTWFVETYGTGTLGPAGVDQFVFRHPNQVLAGADIVGHMEQYRRGLLGRREQFGDSLFGGVSHPIFPEPGGLVAFAGTSGDFESYFLVRRDTDPDTWPVVWHDRPGTTTGVGRSSPEASSTSCWT